MKPYLSVVIPAYNEEKNLKKGVLDEVVDFLKKQPYSWEVVVVDDGSEDKTAQIVEKFTKYKKNVRLIKNPHQGKGPTVTKGILSAQGEIIVFTDMDQATPINQIQRLLPYFAKGYDVAIGSRAGRKGAPFWRKLMAWGFAILRNLILVLPFSDTQCGFKAFKKDTARNLFRKLRLSRGSKKIRGGAVTAGFDIELLFVAQKLGYKIAEVPVDWEYKGTKRVNPIRDSVQGLTGILAVRLNSLRGVYDR